MAIVTGRFLKPIRWTQYQRILIATTFFTGSLISDQHRVFNCTNFLTRNVDWQLVGKLIGTMGIVRCPTLLHRNGSFPLKRKLFGIPFMSSLGNHIPMKQNRWKGFILIASSTKLYYYLKAYHVYFHEFKQHESIVISWHLHTQHTSARIKQKEQQQIQNGHLHNRVRNGKYKDLLRFIINEAIVFLSKIYIL